MKSASLIQPFPATPGSSPSAVRMEQAPNALDATGERHPLLSLISACFWVIRECSVRLSVGGGCVVVADGIGLVPAVWLLKWFKSLIAFVTISIPRLIYSILSYSMTLTVSYLPIESVTHVLRLCIAQFLVFRDNVRTRCCGIQLLAPIPLPQHILRVPRTSPRQIGRTGTTPRRQQPRSTDDVP